MLIAAALVLMALGLAPRTAWATAAQATVETVPGPGIALHIPVGPDDAEVLVPVFARAEVWHYPYGGV